jgi:hypothetical protein
LFTILSESTVEPNFEIGFVKPEIVAVFVPVTSVVSFPKVAVPKFARGYRQEAGLLQKAGASAIHSAEFLEAPTTLAECEKDLPVVTSLIETVNFEVTVEYFTVADNTFPGLTVMVGTIMDGAG